MRVLFSFLSLLIITTTALSQDVVVVNNKNFYYDYKHDLRVNISDGLYYKSFNAKAQFSTPLIKNGKQFVSSKVPFSPQFGVGYRYRIGESMWIVGLDLGFQASKYNFEFTDWENTSQITSETYRYKENIFSTLILPSIKIMYIDGEIFRMYSGAELGVAFDSVRDEDLDSGEIMKNNRTTFAWQINILGFRVGKKYAGFIELGAGYKGLVNLGFSYGL